VRLINGDSLSFPLDRVAMGRDRLQAAFAQYEIHVDRKTAADILRELVGLGVLDRVDQLPDWTDRTTGEAQRKRGAYVYRLNVRLRGLGQRALEAIRGKSGGTASQHCHS
jgi:hypothetical protein